MKLLIVLSVLSLALANSPNIPVADQFGNRAYVDVEEVLESALRTQLYPKGILKVDVDDNRRDPSSFKVELYSSQMVNEQELKATLEKVLRSDLGFANVMVKSESPEDQFYRRRFYSGNKARYYVHFNPGTMMQVLEGLAKKVMATTNLSLEDSMWD